MRQDAFAAKTAQPAWPLEACSDTRAHLLLVDEDADGASAQAAQRSADQPDLGTPGVGRNNDTARIRNLAARTRGPA
ncbi:hypothetical protein ACFU8W_03670 [Streptomyces sp. NPDC057565]|uniref:hypothetical protein n=1 Tax=Streptomyces sp. NPDC057565 TaxID=3346169 RepID=UPI00368A2038